MTYDEARGVVVLASGGFPDVPPVNDVWEYDGQQWTQVVAPTPLPNRVFMSAAYDPAARHSVVFAGLSEGDSAFRDTWTWDGAKWGELVAGSPPPARGGHVTFPALDGTGVIIYGGATPNLATIFDDVWTLRYESTSPEETCSSATDNDLDGLVGCADPDCWARCTPGCPPGVSCDNQAPRCGDGVCNAALENCRICAQDCTCIAACGDSFCEGNETQATCPGDCTP
jgi:hypothetical protein